MKPRMFKRGKDWVCRGILQDKGLRGVVCIGTGRRMETAYKDYARKYNWYRQGCPGAPFWKRSTINAQQQESQLALQRAVKGP